MSAIANWDLTNELPPIDTERFVRLWPEIDVYGRIARALSGELAGQADTARESAA